MTDYYVEAFLQRTLALINSINERIAALESTSIGAKYPNLVEFTSRTGPLPATHDSAIRKLLYAEYSNGAGGTHALADYLHYFEGPGAAIFPFVGGDRSAALEPLSGNLNALMPNKTNWNYSPEIGVLADGLTWFSTNIPGTDVDVLNCSVLVAHKTVSSDNFEFFVGGCEEFFFYKTKANTILGRIHGPFPDIDVSAGSVGKRLHTWISLGNEIKAYRGLTLNAIRSATGRPPLTGSNKLILLSQNLPGLNASKSEFNFFALANAALPDSVRIAFTNAVADFQINRAL